ncbi:MAG: hypothetical protein HY320_05165 [Armatimonadetes bacterium]|nr:hypothetical protein [Armatimonadota bacterium]
MKSTELRGPNGLRSSASGEAIEEIVRVFEEGYRATAALRSEADRLTPSQLESQLGAIERNMLRRISLICDDYILLAAGSSLGN